jgi:hypothetical protein
MMKPVDMIRRAARQGAKATGQSSRLSGACCVLSLLAAYCLLVVSCNPVRYIGIETYNPSDITFPKGVKKVLLINNAFVQQDVPFVSTVRKMPDTVKIAADSAHVDFCRTLGRQIAESPYFEDVRLFDGVYRTAITSSFDLKLTRSEVRQFCDDHDVNAVISVDQLLFSIK